MRKEYVKYSIAAVAALASFTRVFRRVGYILPMHLIRIDAGGNGGYGASRNGRTHDGIDILCKEGDTITAPFSGTITRQFYAYAGDTRFYGFELKSLSGKFMLKIMYCKLLPEMLGKTVVRGKEIAVCQAISKKYGKSVADHLHIEAYENGKRIDPTPYVL